MNLPIKMIFRSIKGILFVKRKLTWIINIELEGIYKGYRFTRIINNTNIIQSKDLRNIVELIGYYS